LNNKEPKRSSSKSGLEHNELLAKTAKPLVTSKRPSSINHDAEFLYMREIEFVPLLTAQQELQLGRLVRRAS